MCSCILYVLSSENEFVNKTENQGTLSKSLFYFKYLIDGKNYSMSQVL